MATVWFMITIIAFPAPSRCFKTTCEIPSVEVGDNATITTHFEEDLSKEPLIDFTVLHLSHDLKESTILSCIFSKGDVTCDNTPCCTWERHVTDVFRVYIHNVSQELEGKFWGLVSPADGRDQKFCNFTLKGLKEVESVRDTTNPTVNVSASTCYTSSIKTRNSHLICTEQSVMIGQTCRVICSPDHYIQENQTSVTYMCVGKNKWSPDIPSVDCEAFTCSTDSIYSTNTHVICSDPPLTIGQTCTVTCIYDHFYQGNQTYVVYTCVGKNKWIPEMAAISCEEIQKDPKTNLINLLILLLILIPAVVIFVVLFKKRQNNKKSRRTEEDLLFPLSASNVELQQSAQELWLECINKWYPELQSQTYFSPPFHYNPASIDVETVAESQLIPQSTQDCLVHIDRALELVLQYLQTLADTPQEKEVMMVLSQLQFGKYHGESGFRAVVALLPFQNTLPAQFLQMHYDQCNFEVLIIHKKKGLITLQIKSVGENFNQLKMTEQKEDEVLMKEVKEAVNQLKNADILLKYLTSDIQNITNITKILVLPNIGSSQLLRAINRTSFAGQLLCDCFGVQSVDDAMKLCLLSDQLSCRQTSSDTNDSSLQSFREWWQHVVSASGPQSLMTPCLYEQLVARLCGLSTTVKFHCVTFMTMKTLGKELSETGDSVSWIVLCPQQVDILNHSPPRVFLSGPPGTGKTIVLILQGLTWLQLGHDVHVVSTRDKSRAATFVIERQLMEITKTSLNRSRVHRHNFDLRKDGEVEAAVNFLISMSKERKLCVISDEAVVDDRKSFEQFCDELIKADPGVYIWGASVHHEVRPLCLEEALLTTPLRSPPVVVREVMESRQIKNKHVHDYMINDVPFRTDGRPVESINHCNGHNNHKGKWPRDCIECGHQVASVLTKLNVGRIGDNVSPSLQYRDVLILCVDNVTDEHMNCFHRRPNRAIGLVRGLRDHKVPVRVLEKGDEATICDMALGISDLVTVASWDDVHGLERKVVVVESGNDWFNERLHAFSRCTLQLVVIHYEPDL